MATKSTYLEDRMRKLLKLSVSRTFRIYCDRGKKGKFYQVVVLKKKRDLAAASKIINTDHNGRKCLAFTHGCRIQYLKRHPKRWVTLRFDGFIVIWERWVCSMVVAHECGHAAYFSMLHMDRQFSPKLLFQEDSVISEPLAERIGNLVGDFWTQWQKGLDKK